MRLRLAVLALAAVACGLTAPAFAAEPAAADVGKYLPDGAGVYVHINVQQFLAAPVIRKAIPMAVDKYADVLMQVVQFAKAIDPNAANIPNEQIKSVLDELKKPETIAKAFDAAKDAVTDVVIVGDPGNDEKVMIVIKCHEAVTPDLVKTFAPLLQGNPQIPVQFKTHETKGQAVYEIQAPQQPQAIFATIPQAGIVCFGPAKALIEKAAQGGGKGAMKPELKKLVAQRKKTDFVFVAMTGKGDDASGVVSGQGRLVLDKDITGELSATYATAEKAAAQAKTMNEGLASAVEAIKNVLGPQGKDVAPVLDKTKAVASGSTVTGNFAIPGVVIEKLLTKQKGADK